MLHVSDTTKPALIKKKKPKTYNQNNQTNQTTQYIFIEALSMLFNTGRDYSFYVDILTGKKKRRKRGRYVLKQGTKKN